MVKDMSVLMMIGLMGLSLAISGGFYLYFWLLRRRLRKARVGEQPPVLPENGGEHDEPLPLQDAAKEMSSLSEGSEEQAA